MLAFILRIFAKISKKIFSKKHIFSNKKHESSSFYAPHISTNSLCFAKKLWHHSHTGRLFDRFLPCKSSFRGFSDSKCHRIINWLLGLNPASSKSIPQCLTTKIRRLKSVKKQCLQSFQDYFQKKSLKSTFWQDICKYRTVQIIGEEFLCVKIFFRPVRRGKTRTGFFYGPYRPLFTIFLP